MLASGAQDGSSDLRPLLELLWAMSSCLRVLVRIEVLVAVLPLPPCLLMGPGFFLVCPRSPRPDLFRLFLHLTLLLSLGLRSEVCMADPYPTHRGLSQTGGCRVMRLTRCAGYGPFCLPQIAALLSQTMKLSLCPV